MNEKCYILIKIAQIFVPKGPVDNKPALVGLDSGLAPNRRQAIIWTNADQVHWRIYAALWGDELIAFTRWNEEKVGASGSLPVGTV